MTSKSFELNKILFKNNLWSIEITKNNQLILIYDEFFVDWITVYNSGKVAYDNPYSIPKYIKNLVNYFALKFINILTA